MARVTEKKRVRIDHTCVDSPVYLNWLGTNGGRNYWLFKVKQTYGLTVTVNGEYQPYTPDIENAQGVIFETGRSAVPRVTMGGQVRSEDKLAISKMLYSTNVLMLMNPLTWETDTGGPRWQVVRPIPGTFKTIETDSHYENIEVTVELTEINTQNV